MEWYRGEKAPPIPDGLHVGDYDVEPTGVDGSGAGAEADDVVTDEAEVLGRGRWAGGGAGGRYWQEQAGAENAGPEQALVDDG
ncbi:hypothetical protein MRX96_008465 [Rhipicephalus microplus]